MATLAIAIETIPAQLMVGEAFSYIIHVVNLGPDRATSVMVTNLVSELVDPRSLSSGCDRQGRVVSCSLGTIEPGAEKIVDIMARPTTVAGPIVNAAATRGTGTNVATVVHLAFAAPRVNLVQFFRPQ